jgi:hypothetical protein
MQMEPRVCFVVLVYKVGTKDLEQDMTGVFTDYYAATKYYWGVRKDSERYPVVITTILND